jgi:hypothetical protein
MCCVEDGAANKKSKDEKRRVDHPTEHIEEGEDVLETE